MGIEVALRHAFGAFRLDVDFAAPAGITALFGRSGAGKTTVVNAVAGLMRPREGRIAVDGATLLDTGRGVAVPRHRRRIGSVFQEGRLFPHLSVRHNLAFGGWFAPRGAPRPDFDHVVELLGIDHLLDRRPGRLSGGEQSRVAIGRALLASPRLLLMDEPLASLDEARKAEILPYLERLRDETQLPILYVSHSIPEVARLATTVVALAGGRVERMGPAAAVLTDPASFPLLGRQEAGAMIPARVLRHDPDGLSVVEASGGRLILPRIAAELGAPVRIRIRARDVILAAAPPSGISALNVLPVTIAEIGASDGGIVDLALVCGSDRILARITRRSLAALDLAPGRPCFAILKSIAVGRRDIAGGADATP
ncbi:molybdenum ABC transporter ATP-binding protein [soil metagenome]